jgi:hypothetical protein
MVETIIRPKWQHRKVIDITSDDVEGLHRSLTEASKDHVFALCSLLGFQFAPRIPDLKSRRLHSSARRRPIPRSNR